MTDDWKLAGSTKDTQSITSDWEFTRRIGIAGVELHEVRNVPKSGGVLTEIYRRDWNLDPGPVDQVFQNLLMPHAVAAWHAHESTTDRIFISTGMMRVVLFDGRADSPTRGAVEEFRLGEARPALLVVPPKVWHGVQNIGDRPSLLLNLVDRAYRYEDPDHWRLPVDTDAIPYRFPSLAGQSAL